MALKKPIFKPSAAAEAHFIRALRKVGRVSAHLISLHVHPVWNHQLTKEPEMEQALRSYSRLIEPWAKRQTVKMLDMVSTSNRRAYNRKSKEIGQILKLNVAEKAVGQVAENLLRDQVDLITTLPLKSGIKAQTMAQEAAYNGTRAKEVAKELMRLNGSDSFVEFMAVRIARTEIAKSNASINEARAKEVGSNQYIWRNSGDAAVRQSHKIYQGKKLDGMIFDWDDPPTLDDGHTMNPGNIYNCRCYAEAVFS